MKLVEAGFFSDDPDQIGLRADWGDMMYLLGEKGLDHSGLEADGAAPREVDYGDIHSTLDVILG